MIEKEIENLNNLTNKIKCDYKDVFYEKTKQKNYIFLNRKLDDIKINYINGVSLTIKNNEVDYFMSSNSFDELADNFKKIESEFEENICEKVNLELENEDYEKNRKIFEEKEKIELLKYIDNFCRNFSDKINQVSVTLSEGDFCKYIVRDNKLIIENKISTRLSIVLTAKEKDLMVNAVLTPGFTDDLTKFLDKNYLNNGLEELCSDAVAKLNSVKYAGGNVPVIINSGFGAVLFHEACGHAMESCSIVNSTSVLAGKLNSKIASEKVTIIDDGTIDELYGSSKYDDQGNKTKKNVLIKDGILVNYLTEINDGIKLNLEPTGSARRENYSFKAISRMNNTYLEKGTDKFEDMLKDIKNGIYAKNLGGGSVDPITGKFNFFVSFGYIIKDGVLTEPVKDITLIGDTFSVLKNVEMVSNDLSFSTGMCGSESGWVPVTCGQPTIKLSKILVGGNK